MSSIRARLSSTTPLGWPVVPPVYIRIAPSASSGSGGSAEEPAADDVLIAEVVRNVSAADQHHLLDAGFGSHRVDHRREKRVGEAHPAAGVLQDEAQLQRRQAEVERIDDGAAEEAGVVELEKLVSIESHDREAVVGVDAELGPQAVRQPAGPVQMVGIARGEGSVEHGGLVRSPAHGGKEIAVVDELLHASYVLPLAYPGPAVGRIIGDRERLDPLGQPIPLAVITYIVCGT